MNSFIRGLFSLFGLFITVPFAKADLPVQSLQGSAAVNFATPSNGDIDIRGQPFASTAGQFVTDGMGTSADAAYVLTYSPSSSDYRIILGLSRIGATGTYSKASGWQDISALFATEPVTYTFSGSFDFSSPGLNFSTELYQIGNSVALFSEQYDVSNASGGPGGSLTFGPISGQLLPSQAIEWDWFAQIAPDAVADSGASFNGNLDLTFTYVPEPMLSGVLAGGLAFLRRRR